MKDVARRKQYVEVVATHYIDGSVRPQKIVLATGPVYEICLLYTSPSPRD